MAQKADKPHFDVHPSVVYQLGESLITDAIQALIELVKNCYDADATYAKIRIDTAGILDVTGANYPATGGRIIVEDDGNGMDEDTIRNGWLLISNRAKRELKEQKKTTPGGRTPLGDKGLGRLGAQRLGENIDIFTKTKNGAGYHFAFSWLDFETAPSLADVDVHLAKCEFPRKKGGTNVIISNLQEIETWRGQESLKRLEQELSKMISPYKAIRDFVVVVETDGKQLELMEVSDKVRELAPVKYSIRFDGEKLSITGKARLDFFRPNGSAEAEEFALLAESDGGAAFFDFLAKDKRSQYLKVTRSNAKKWFVEFRRERRLDDLDKLERDPVSPSVVANPGPFSGEIDSFDLGPETFRRQSVFDRLQEFRAHIKELSGIRVYRDGFAIRVDRDWLKLGAQWTSATSYYGLKPDNTLGYIALSARDNMVLEETTDREGFKDTPYFRNFYALLLEFRRFTNEAHEFFGRSWSEFQKTRRETLARVDSRKTVESIAATIGASLGKVAEQRKSLQTFRRRLETDLKASSEVLQRVTAAPQLTSAHKEKMREASEALAALVDEATRMLNQLGQYLDELTQLKSAGQVLEDRVDGLRRQMDDMYETVALGLTAEALSHEIFQISDNLARRTKSVEARLSDNGESDRTITAFVETVRTAVMALRKQVSYLSPALRYVREQRHELVVADFLAEIESFYRERLARNDIHIKVVQKGDEPFVIRMNRGKLAQVIDNLVLNSEYWLSDDLKRGRIPKGEITFEIERPFVRIADNGRGIDPSVEAALFEPFVSAKARGVGRGLGLFIVKQLLDSEGCHVGVVPERNRSDRLFKFQIDLRGAFNG
jgi:signal transduction histidine kinase